MSSLSFSTNMVTQTSQLDSPLQPDINSASAFLQALDPIAQAFTFQTFDDNQTRRDPSLAHILHGTLEQHSETLTKLNNAGAGVYVAVNRTDLKGRESSNVTGVRALFIDSDNAMPQQYHLEPSIIVQSSETGKGHSYWLLEEIITDLESFKPLQKALIQHYNSDHCIHDLSRVMRIPGFYHRKCEPQLVTLKALNNMRYSIEEVLAGVSTTNTTATARVNAAVPSLQTDKATKKIDSAKLADVLKEQVSRVSNAVQGERNNTLNTASYIIGQLVPYGLDESEARKKLGAAAVLAELDDTEIEVTMNSGFTAGKRDHNLVNFNSTNEAKSSAKKLLDILKSEYQPRLSWNVMQSKPMLDGDTVDFTDIEMEIVAQHDLHVDSNKLASYITTMAKDNQFNPVTEYLTRVRDEITPASDIIDRLAIEALGLTDVLERKYLTRFLIAAVARAFQPGCKVDTVLILQGKQGYRKTTFFQTLFTPEYFITLGDAGNERDELLSLHQHWCIEYGEFETAASKKDVSAMKNFLSRQVDNFREPYGSRAENHSRHFVLCGTTNKDQFLFDETGNRRFWVVNIPQPIKLDWVKEHRDEVWSAAVALYQAGQEWWLTDDDQALSDKTNKTYEATSVWHDVIVAWLQGKYCSSAGTTYYKGQAFQTKDVLLNAVGKPAGQWTKGDEMQVAKVLKFLGLEKKDTKVDGMKGKYWIGTPQLASTVDGWSVSDDELSDF